ncbi:hypothetical protein Taro_034271, partial [Colocasia esculenta]|nr:hypothetical protein [Colocasia esculenta]
LVLEDVIGLTTRNADGLASDASSGRCAYLAGCVVVLYDVGTGARKHLMVSSRAPKPLSCVALARQGRSPVAAGESGHVPAVLIWDSSTGNLLSELKGHQSGVQSIDFSSDGKSLVSLGYINDGYICLWDWRVGRLITKVKASTTLGPILSVSFLSEGSSFITIGRKHLKLWTLGSLKTLSTNVGKELPSLDGKAANLGCCKGSSFISVACSAWSTKTAASDQVVDWFPLYAVTETGCECAALIVCAVKFQVEKGFALSVSENLIACACNSGIVQLFSVPSLLHVGRLDYGGSNGQVDLTNMSSYAQPSESCAEHSDTIPDAIACQFLSPTKLAVIYADHSFYIWDIDHTPKISKCCLLVAHSACIWDVQNLPCKNLNKIDPTYESSGYPSEVSMATCSADGTIRLWDLVLHPRPEGKQTQLTLSQQIYNSVDNELAASVQLVSCGILEQENVDKELLAQGFRSMSVSSDGQYVAAGDCRGNLHVFNLHTSEYTCIEEAHDAEILSVNFSNKQAGNNAELEGPFFLVTGSRDRTVHVHNIRGSFDLIESFEDHSAPVTSVILTSILFRDIIITDSGCKVVRRHNQLACHGTIYDMAIDRARKLVVTVGQNKRINKYSLSSGKLVASFKEEGDPGQPIKVAIDPSGSYVLCSYSNKSLRIYDFVTGELVALAMGHAEVVTGSIFLPNCKHIVSVSGDSCIFIWKLPASLSSKMLQKTKENAGCPPTTVATKSTNTLEIAQQKVESAQPNVDSDYCLSVVMLEKEDNGVVDDGSREDSKFMFSISRLPKWAQTKVESKPVISQASI